MKVVEAELVVDTGDELGEGPVWDVRSGRLWWTDILGRRVHSLDPDSGDVSTLQTPQEVGALVPRASGGFLAAVRDGFAALGEDGSLDLLVEVGADRPDLRMNDGKCDRAGRFWAGTMAFDCTPYAGCLYVLDPDLSLRTVLTDLTVPNGLAWTDDDTTLYYIDSGTGGIDRFDFDVDKGLLGDRRQVVDLALPEGSGQVPDGMCIDAEGCLWVAVWGGSEVRRYRPDGTLDALVTLPTPLVTCPTFGGPDLRDLYVTTAHMGNDEALRQQSPAGALFRARLDVPGVAPYAFAG
jgi:sugar lactone lactonase YvrE